ncbi:MAG: SAM-dependent methyltransferase [Promethearchaeota archaeon]|nr:MAG: SAM-dependent methyltransferase [Candidatus Lokiarchaeota archaeon]
MSLRTFYEKHLNFSLRTYIEYFISPGIKCKFDIIKTQLPSSKTYPIALDLGCSGNSLLLFLNGVTQSCLLDIAEEPLKYYSQKYKLDYFAIVGKHDTNNLNPINGDIKYLPYRDKSVDLICILDVLEHIRDDNKAIRELSRVLKKEGKIIVTVPYNMNKYTPQDRLIGHFRRYGINKLVALFEKSNLRIVNLFGVYGSLFKLTEIQAKFPEKTEENIIRLRKNYMQNLFFRFIWNVINHVLAFIMKLNVKLGKIRKMYNIGMILEKN